MKGYKKTDKWGIEEITEMNKKDHVRNMLKKGMRIGLCMALVGSLAAGSYVSAKESEKFTLLKQEEGTDEAAPEETVDEKEKTVGFLDVSDIVEEAMPSIVSITTKSIQEVQNYYYGLFGYGGYAPQQRETEGRGSGIILAKDDSELLIVTNYHVVKGANTISVAFVDNEVVEGKVKGYDEVQDLAIVSVALDDVDKDTLKEIAPAKVGSSDDLKVGEQVVAIGNAMGYGQSVTTGIVSAKTRYSEMNGTYGGFATNDTDAYGVNMIQTDAAINPGNSGGALLNMDGELVGINSAKLASTEVEGMGYAIAISDVEETLTYLMNEEARDKLDDDKHGILGITGATVSAEEAKKYGFPQGVYVNDVTKDGPAAKAGLEAGDFITEFRGRTLDSIAQLVDYLNYYEPGEEVDLTVIREGEEMTITVTLGEQTDEYRQSAGIQPGDEEPDADAPDEDDRFSDKEGGQKDEDDYYDDYDPYADFWGDWSDGYFNGFGY